MTILARILAVLGIGVIAYVVFFGRPREVLIQEPGPPQLTQEPKPAPTPRPTAKPRPRPRPTPEPAEIFQPENTESHGAIYRALQSQPQAAPTRSVRKAPSVYEWEQSYDSALSEKDPSKLQDRIDMAQAALNRRLQELDAGDDRDSPNERQAIRNAQLGLNLLKYELSNKGTRR